MKQLLFTLLLLVTLGIPGLAQAVVKYQGLASQGNTQVSSGGVGSTNKVLGSYPSCTVSVYLTGTLTLATIYSDSILTPKSNPFTATSEGYLEFYIAPGTYDLRFSGTGITTPFTRSIVDIGLSRAAQLEFYSLASRPTCNASLRGRKIQLTDNYKGTQTCTLTTGSTYSWVSDGNVFDVRNFGAFSGATGATNIAAINSAITAATTGDTVLIPEGSYSISSAIAVNKGIQLIIDGIVTQITSSTNGVTITSSNVIVRGKGTLIGPQKNSYNDDERAININQAGTAGTYLTDIIISDITISTWGGYGVIVRYVNGYVIERIIIDDIYYTGIGTLSCKKGKIYKTKITDIEGSVAGNAYGIFISHRTVPAEARSEDTTVEGNYARNIPNWECFDTHGGKNISFIGNQGYACKIGLNITTNTDGTSPEGNVAAGNALDSERTDGGASHGILFAGVSEANPATGAITGNTVRGYGDITSAEFGSISFYFTQGLTLAGNSTYVPGRIGFSSAGTNKGFSATGNTVVDVWSSTVGTAFAFRIVGGNTTGTVSGTTILRGTKVATAVNAVGLVVDNITGNDIFYLKGYESVTTSLDDAGGFARSGFANYDKTNNRYGWGTTVPLNFFHLYDANPTIRLQNSSGGNGSYLTVDSAQDFSIWNLANRHIYFGTNNLVRGTILSNGKWGFGTAIPDRAVEINDASGNALRLTYNDSDGSAANYVDYNVSSGGNAVIAPSGGTTNVTGSLAVSTNAAITGTLSVGGGTALTKILKGTVTIDPASIAANTVSSQTFTLTGAVAGDSLRLNPPTTGLTAGVLITQCYVSAADTITIIFHNTTAGAIDLASASWTYSILR